MKQEPTIIVEIDPDADAAYVTLSDGAVARTVEFSPEIMVDLDELDVAVGVELLTLTSVFGVAEVAELARRFHVPTSVAAALPAAFEALARWTPANISTAATGTGTLQRSGFATLRSSVGTLEECAG
ncbi:DUF2283 domain-containing protein [Streptomyces sp. SLBN-31]|uniref:DUF2283 domain-containing protein n=1 Tax=Streptomyces sp. SLBN-31 TaxID=2768444 RepID=UPI00114FE379|nr:DUF2283 domain-containing protein [Streptomyces sp. SLBN-31]